MINNDRVKVCAFLTQLYKIDVGNMYTQGTLAEADS